MKLNEILGSANITMLEACGTTGGFTTNTESINMENYRRCAVLFIVTDAGTGTAITLKQGTSATTSTTLGFTKYWYIADVTASNTWTEATASSDTFTTGTSSKTGMYLIDVDASTLTNGYSWIRCNAATAAGATHIALVYIPYNPRYATGAADQIDPHAA
jgi:hypothetical protein